MKVLTVAAKDLRQSFRNRFALAFMFFIPILVTGLFYIIFGGFGDDEASFTLPRTTVQIVNLDQGVFPADDPVLPAGEAAAGSLGDVLVGLLQSDDFAGLVEVTVAADEAAARRAVAAGEAGVAIIIPPAFTDAATRPGVSATVQIVQDPALILGPRLVGAIVEQFVAREAARKIGAEVVVAELTRSGVPINPELMQGVAGQFAADTPGPDGDSAAARLVNSGSPDSSYASSTVVTSILRPVMAGMMIFFTFFTGAASMQSILQEEEAGTLARLFTTPTGKRTILAGKFLAVLATLAVQVTVLLIFGRLVFAIAWGQVLPLILAGIGIVMAAGTMGLFIVSWLKNSRQAGVVFGGVLTISGMLGLIPVFTSGSGISPAMEMASLLSPQGWAMRALSTVVEGGNLADVGRVVAVLLVWSALLAGVGQYRLRRRFV